MTAVRHLIVDGSSSSVDNGGAGTISYHTLYLPRATGQTFFSYREDRMIYSQLILLFGSQVFRPTWLHSRPRSRLRASS
jgi:hypothetical protein